MVSATSFCPDGALSDCTVFLWHYANRFARQNPIARRDVNPLKTCKYCMVSAVMFNDQDLPQVPKWTRKGNFSIKWGQNTGPSPGCYHDSF